MHYIWRFWICDYEYFFHTKNQCFTIHFVHSHNSTLFSSCVDKNSLWNLGCVLSQKILFISECIKNCSLCSISSSTQNKQSYLWSYRDFITHAKVSLCGLATSCKRLVRKINRRRQISYKNARQRGSQKVKKWRLFFHPKTTKPNKLKSFGYVKLLEFSLHKKIQNTKKITDLKKKLCLSPVTYLKTPWCLNMKFCVLLGRLFQSKIEL